jgi:1-acyl-sn-glycerol-3-phosphate acyltransferase
MPAGRYGRRAIGGSRSITSGDTWRARRRLALIALLVAVHLLPHGLWRLVGWRSPWPTRFLRRAGRAAGIDVRIVGRPVRQDVLIVANHLSWLDILILAGASGARFVAKDEVAAWPVLGFLSGLNRTVYVSRGQRADVRAQADQIRSALVDGQPVALFAEGTTGDGRALLPFRASLLAALSPHLPGVVMQPVAIDYGADAPLLAWRDTGVGTEMMRVLGLPGRRRAVIRFLAPCDPARVGDRKALAAAAQTQVAAALGIAP